MVSLTQRDVNEESERQYHVLPHYGPAGDGSSFGGLALDLGHGSVLLEYAKVSFFCAIILSP